MSKSVKARRAALRPLRVKLIFNGESGKHEESPQQLVSILEAMQDQRILPEVFMVRPDCQLETVVRQAIRAGTKLIVVAGGDGTIDSILGAMVGTDATLGIIPTGTRNNLAFNLGVTGEIADAVRLLRRGRRLKIDMGRVHGSLSSCWFVEGVALGLISDLYPMADELQHGDLTQIGALLSTLVAAAPSRLRIVLDGHKHMDAMAHLLLITNMPFLGPHFQISPKVSFRDGRLDVFTFSDVGKLAMMSLAALAPGGQLDEAGIKHYRARHIRVASKPQMPVIADGTLVRQGAGVLSVNVHPRALAVMAGTALTGEVGAVQIADSKLAVNG